MSGIGMQKKLEREVGACRTEISRLHVLARTLHVRPLSETGRRSMVERIVDRLEAFMKIHGIEKSAEAP